METLEITVPPAIAGVDVKWIVRGIVRNVLACDSCNAEQNGYAHALMVIRDRLWPVGRYGKGARDDKWQATLDRAVQLCEFIDRSWNGEGYEYATEEHAVNTWLRYLAGAEASHEVANWWLSFLVDA